MAWVSLHNYTAIIIAPLEKFLGILGAQAVFPSLDEIWMRILVTIDAKPFLARVETKAIWESLGWEALRHNFLTLG